MEISQMWVYLATRQQIQKIKTINRSFALTLSAVYDIWQRSNRCVKLNEYGVNITPAQRIGESYLKK